MTRPRYKTTNWKQYNQALINRGSLTFWIDEEAIKQGHRRRPRLFSDHHGTYGEACIFNAIERITGIH